MTIALFLCHDALEIIKYTPYVPCVRVVRKQLNNTCTWLMKKTKKNCSLYCNQTINHSLTFLIKYFISMTGCLNSSSQFAQTVQMFNLSWTCCFFGLVYVSDLTQNLCETNSYKNGNYYELPYFVRKSPWHRKNVVTSMCRPNPQSGTNTGQTGHSGVFEIKIDILYLHSESHWVVTNQNLQWNLNHCVFETNKVANPIDHSHPKLNKQFWASEKCSAVSIWYWQTHFV